MSTPYKQITGIIKHLLDEYKQDCQDRKCIFLNLSKLGNVQINAIGSWIKTFCIRRFKLDFWDFNKTINVYTGEVDTKMYYYYEISLEAKSRNPQITATFEEMPFLDNCDYYLSFVFNVDQKKVRSVFSRLNNFFVTIAPKYPDIKMSFTGDVKLWEEKDKTEKCIRMISEAIGDVMKYDSTMNFADNITMKYFNSADRHVVVNKVKNKLTKNLLGVSDEDDDSN